VPKKSKGGRPSKLTPAIRRRICRLIRVGSYAEVAAAAVGISKTTFYAWMKRGRRQRAGQFREFLNAVRRASAQDEVSDLAIIHKARDGGQLIEERTITRRDGSTEVIKKWTAPQWNAAAWKRERKTARRWARFERTELAQLRERLKSLEREISRHSGTNNEPAQGP
jgi:hypothetical protein